MKRRISTKSYTFKFAIEPDRFPDGRQAYRAYIPALEAVGGSTWGYTKEEAIKNLQEVARLVVEELLKTKRTSLLRRSRVSSEPLVTVSA